MTPRSRWRVKRRYSLAFAATLLAGTWHATTPPIPTTVSHHPTPPRVTTPSAIAPLPQREMIPIQPAPSIRANTKKITILRAVPLSQFVSSRRMMELRTRYYAETRRSIPESVEIVWKKGKTKVSWTRVARPGDIIIYRGPGERGMSHNHYAIVERMGPFGPHLLFLESLSPRVKRTELMILRPRDS